MFHTGCSLPDPRRSDDIGEFMDDNCRTILIVQEETDVQDCLRAAVAGLGYRPECAAGGIDVANFIRRNCGVAAVLLGIPAARGEGLELLREIRSLDGNVPVIAVSGASSSLNVLEAMRNGASDFLAKPICATDLEQCLKRLLGDSPAEAPVVSVFAYYGSKPRIRQIQEVLPQVAASDAPVLIQGEAGSGKEVLARELHARSARAGKPFLKLNCAALPLELVESELLGHERGVFNGGFRKKAGMLEMADGGTVLLDEVGDMDLKLQAKLLQVLQDSVFQRIGGRETARVNVRVIAATRRNLEQAVAAQTFREDLCCRLNAITLQLPPLRDRREDIVPLAEFLLKKHGQGKVTPQLTSALQSALLAHSWPGNIRELENAMRKLLILGDQNTILADLRGRAAAEIPGSAAPGAVAPALSGGHAADRLQGAALQDAGHRRRRAGHRHRPGGAAPTARAFR
jgi:two-component system, NtrC family, response regulator AtoC